jgi:hypothetical protein
MVGLWNDMLDVEILQRDGKEADHHKDNAPDSPRRKNFPDKKNRPNLGEKRGRTGDRIDQGEITFTVGCNKTHEIDRLEKARGEGEAPEFGRGVDQKGGKNTQGNKKRKIKDDTQEEDPEEEFSWPVPSLRKEIP